MAYPTVPKKRLPDRDSLMQVDNRTYLAFLYVALHCLQIMALVPSTSCSYTTFIPVLLQTGHVPRPLET